MRQLFQSPKCHASLAISEVSTVESLNRVERDLCPQVLECCTKRLLVVVVVDNPALEEKLLYGQIKKVRRLGLLPAYSTPGEIAVSLLIYQEMKDRLLNVDLAEFDLAAQSRNNSESHGDAVHSKEGLLRRFLVAM